MLRADRWGPLRVQILCVFFQVFIPFAADLAYVRTFAVLPNPVPDPAILVEAAPYFLCKRAYLNRNNHKSHPFADSKHRA